MLEPQFIQASLPLFESGEVEVLEWSFDTVLSLEGEPEWLRTLLETYSESQQLLAHGVYYSMFDAHWGKRQEDWLKKLKSETTKYNYKHITEHFGFMSSHDAHRGAPLPVPLNKATLNIGVDRLRRLQDCVEIPVGIENLALSFSKKDVSEQGEFIAELINSINGFVLLDLHNIYCQAQNFNCEMMEIIDCYPLNNVKEIHISGGSWEIGPFDKKQIRRDTHDGNVPIEIFRILPEVLAKCMNVEQVIFERLGNTFNSTQDILDFRGDFQRIKSCVQNCKQTHESIVWQKNSRLENNPISDEILFTEQQLLRSYLTQNIDIEGLRQMKFKNWDTSKWDLNMIATGMDIAKKWNE